ncbi:MAG: hypothetical protein U1A72_05890 [Sulfuritalea sp.]|nr:hypothetical protein [Sulfuritalea sp.]
MGQKLGPVRLRTGIRYSVEVLHALPFPFDSKTNVLPLSAYGPFGFEQWLTKLKRPNAKMAFSVAF